MEEDTPKCGPDSPDGVDGLAAADEDDDECESDDDGSASESESEHDEDDEAEETEVEELDAAALLSFSKSRLEKAPPMPPASEATLTPTEAEGADDDEKSEEIADAGDAADEGVSQAVGAAVAEFPPEEEKMDADAGASTTSAEETEEEPAVKDQAYYIELAMRKTQESKIKAKNDEDPGYMLKLAEKKVEEANAKAREDEEAFVREEAIAGEREMKPAEAKPTRSENSELWALLSYSKKRLETGSTPQVGGGKKAGSKNGSVRGDDNQSVSSKLSKSSRRSMKSAPVSVVGGPGDLMSPLGAPQSSPFPDVTDNGDDSVEGSVSLESETKNSDANEDESNNSEDDESSDEEDEEEQEDDLPDFLKDGEDFDPEEAKMLYEAAKFKAASILSVSEEKLTDVQMLQAIAIAEDAARKGDEKFSTKRSLFKLNEARVEDLKSFLNLSMGSAPGNSQQSAKRAERQAVGWGIGRVSPVLRLCFSLRY